MAKPLREPPPSSSVARLFDMGAAARAIATPAAEPNPPPSALPTPEAASDRPIRTSSPPVPQETPARQATGEQPTLKRELVLTPSADQAFGTLVELYRRTTGTRLTSSHVARAMLKAVAHCMDEIEREATRIGPLKLPANARGRELERERFEARIADAFAAGMRASAAFHHDDY
ncbi:MAG: hypothetical protein KJZ54_02055 [Phycisphaerales bacterium]|nr:hypothetical protein [Phycisphaerales bacterium]